MHDPANRNPQKQGRYISLTSNHVCENVHICADLLTSVLAFCSCTTNLMRPSQQIET
jgi:hypothetical protein